jgi:hypothetical protein
MSINLTKKQYECLIKALEAANSVYGILGDSVSDEYKKQSNEIEELTDYFLSLARDFGMEHITQKYKEKLILDDVYAESLDEVIDDYNNEIFWDELQTRLGKRDFERTITEAEKKEIIKNHGWYPDRIRELYEVWSKELEDNGVENLGILKDKK